MVNCCAAQRRAPQAPGRGSGSRKLTKRDAIPDAWGRVQSISFGAAGMQGAGAGEGQINCGVPARLMGGAGQGIGTHKSKHGGVVWAHERRMSGQEAQSRKS